MAIISQQSEGVDPLLVSGTVFRGGVSNRIEPIGGQEIPKWRHEDLDFYLSYLEQDELRGLELISVNNPQILSELRGAINQARSENVHLMPWVKKILGSYDSAPLDSPDLQFESREQYQGLAQELLGIWCSLTKNNASVEDFEKSKEFVIHSLGAYYRAMTELASLAGNKTPLHNLRLDPLYQDMFPPDTPLQFLQDEQSFPDAVAAHNIIAVSQLIHGLYLQLESGQNLSDLHKELQKYYSRFGFDENTTSSYTHHEKLIGISCLELIKLLKESPLEPNSSICVAGCGRNPVELRILEQLKINGLIPDGCIIDMFDMQSAEALGINNYLNPEDNDLVAQAKQLGLKVRFYPGTSLSDFAKKNNGKYHMVTLIGSVINNDPNQLHWLSDFVSLKELLSQNSNSSLIVDTANLEKLALQNPHYIKWLEYQQDHPLAAPGSRRSAHMDAYAQIFPTYYFRAINALLGFQHSEPVVWDADGKPRSLWIEKNSQQGIPSLGKAVLTLMAQAYGEPHPLLDS